MSKTIAIMQPTYLPWIGYFDLIDRVDAFVLLDSVQFEKQSWQQRNRIRTARDLEWLTVPVLHSGHFGQLICATQLATPGQFVKKHLRTIEMNYSRAEFFKDYFLEFSQAMSEAGAIGTLAGMNIYLLRFLLLKLGIATPLHVSSQMGSQGKRSGLLVDICRSLDSSEYLSPPGSAEYLREDYPQFEEAGIHVWLHAYEHPAYHQLHKPFMPYACVLDLLFNEGPCALQIIRSGRRDRSPL